ncbi:MAG: pyridoxal phosphate-dependent aminotransferase, partial [Gammaproteobacteria bacterium]|nr:pyridoxal phosphate-dependent aminotransferase [Gammaproteobacteria bacterium]NIR83908.1 pyridoxal phosphate-dependent aminotransferase [Gammaproteobacteria bacterium]NIU05273.1 pyridoxal phosphate-dependent aminotransferase [Gammaproteobacteria bacterium]NIX86546.1 pyridoxal phosphate-dependent aminotransferase [Gammaproteobacteria bacterium]
HVSRLGANWVVQQGAIAAYASKARWLPRLLETNTRHQARIKDCVDGIDGME